MKFKCTKCGKKITGRGISTLCMSCVQKGKKISQENINKMLKANPANKKGYKHTDEFRKSCSDRMKNKKPFFKGKKHSNKSKIKMSNAKKGKKLSLEVRRKISESNRGKLGNAWKGGITKLSENIRKNFKYRQWRSDIFTRDNYNCQRCNKKGGKIEAHHIKEFSKILRENNVKIIEDAINCEELWNINNGITLCKDCHKKTDTYLKRLKN